MGFLTGFITGAAESIDKQLQSDMKRTQERMEGMEQYRVTRRRARLEEQEKEKKELSKVLNNLARFVDGDEDKAIQLFNAGGGTIEGASDLYNELLTNQKAGKDVSAAIEFAEAGAAPGEFKNFIQNNITPVTPLAFDENVRATGLYGLFQPDVGAAVSRRVDEAAPLPETSTGSFQTAMAKIDRSGFIAAEEAREKEKERERAAGRFGMEEERFKTSQEQARQSMKLADAAEERANRLEKANADQRKIENARAEASALREQARLDIAVANAEREAKAFVTQQEIAGLTVEERRLDIEKKRNAPKFSTYEAMLVAADQEIARIETIPPDQRTAADAAALTQKKAIRQKALSGIKGVADAESTTTFTPSFSKQSIDSIINSEIKRQLQPVGLIRDIEGQIEYKIEGNEVQYFDRMFTALDNVETRVFGIEDTQMNNALKAQRDSLKSQLSVYKNKLIDSKKTTDIGTQTYTTANGEEKTQALNPAFLKTLKAGTVVQYKKNGKIINALWTGSRYI